MAELRYSLFLLISGGYCALAAIIRIQLALTGIRPIGKPASLIKNTPTSVKLILLLLIFTVLSSILSEYSGTLIGQFRREGLLTIAIYILSTFFLSKYFLPQKWMLYLVAVSTTLFCVLSLAQLTGANPFLLYPEGFNYYDANIYYSGEFLGTLGNTGLGAAFLSIAIGVFSMSVIKLDAKEKWLLTIPIFLASIVLFNMGVDAGIVALAVGLLLMLPVAVTDQKSFSGTLFVFAVVFSAFAISKVAVLGDGHISFIAGRLLLFVVSGIAVLAAAIAAKSKHIAQIPAKYYRIGSISAVAAAVCFALIYLWFYNGESSGMIYEASEVLRGRWDDEFGTKRIYIWRNALGGVSGNLLLGTGPDTLGHWGIAPFTRYSEELGTMLTTWIDAAHNEYLQILACGGILSLLCYLGALGNAMLKWFKQPVNKLSAIAGAGALLYCIQAFFSISMFISAPFFWIVLAVLIYSQNGKEAAGKKMNKPVK